MGHHSPPSPPYPAQVVTRKTLVNPCPKNEDSPFIHSKTSHNNNNLNSGQTNSSTQAIPLSPDASIPSILPAAPTSPAPHTTKIPQFESLSNNPHRLTSTTTNQNITNPNSPPTNSRSIPTPPLPWANRDSLLEGEHNDKTVDEFWKMTSRVSNAVELLRDLKVQVTLTF